MVSWKVCFHTKYPGVLKIRDRDLQNNTKVWQFVENIAHTHWGLLHTVTEVRHLLHSPEHMHRTREFGHGHWDSLHKLLQKEGQNCGVSCFIDHKVCRLI